MTAPGKRTKKKKFVRITKGTKEIRFRDSSKGHFCGLCGKRLQGVPKGDLRKLSKTEKRPSILFGGVLCNRCRNSVFDEAIMLKLGLITQEDVSLRKKTYVNVALKHINL